MNNKIHKKKHRVSLRIKWTFFISSIIFFLYLICSILIFMSVNNSVIKIENSNIDKSSKIILKQFRNMDKLNINSEKKLIDSISKINDEKIIIKNDKNKVLYKNEDFKAKNFIITNKFGIFESFTKSYAIVSKENNKVIGHIYLHDNLNNYHRILRYLREIMIPISLGVILISLILGFFLVEIVLKRLKIINKTIETINDAPESDVRIPLEYRNDEISDIVDQFNNMLDKMQNYTNLQKEFVQDVSHELRTPVAVVEGHLKLLNRWGKDDPKVLEESLNSSLQEMNRIKKLIQEMLDLTRIEQSENQHSNEYTEIKSLVSQIYNDFKVLHPNFNISLDYDIREDAMVKIYRNHLEQIIVILLDNAIKYSSDKKEIYISVSRNENFLEIAIQDFGIGISVENQKKIFNRFYRADKDRSRESGGNGLGLPIAKQLVKNYNGFMYVESMENSGSIFRIELPLVNKKD